MVPISRKAGQLAVLRFIKDTDLIHIDMNNEQSALEAHTDLQESIDSWGQLLMASGGIAEAGTAISFLFLYDVVCMETQ